MSDLSLMDSELSPKELMRLRIVRRAYSHLVGIGYPPMNIWARDGDLMASSDGKAFITINRRILTYPYHTFAPIVALNIVHEICHYFQNEEELESENLHSKKYYLSFHNECFKHLPIIIKELNKTR